MRIITDFEQRSEAWHEFRKGKIFGTRLGSLWSSREYTKDDAEKLLVSRGIDLKAYQAEFNERRKAEGLKSKPYTKADLEVLLTDVDRDELRADQDKKIEYYQILADQVANGVDIDDHDHLVDMSAMDRGTALEEEAAAAFATAFNKELFSVACCVSDVDERIAQSPDKLVKPAKGKTITEAVEVKCLASAKHLMAWFERKVPEEYWTQKIQYFVVNPDLQKLYWVFYDPRIPILPMFCLVIKREDMGHWPETMLKYQLRTLKELDNLTVKLFNESGNILMPALAEKG